MKTYYVVCDKETREPAYQGDQLLTDRDRAWGVADIMQKHSKRPMIVLTLLVVE